jgi:hypothetical protein
MTESIMVAIAPEPKRVRILAQLRDQQLLQAILKLPTPLALRSLPLLLEALAGCQAMPLSVVLCADESGTSSLSAMFDILQRTRANPWPVGLAVVPTKHRREADFSRHFDDLRQLCCGGGQE